MERRKARRKTPITYQQFVFEITDWWPTYSLRVSQGKDELEPYWEHATLQLKSACIFPADRIGQLVDFCFIGNRNIQNPEILKHEPDWKPHCVGSLDMRGERRQYLGSLPYDILEVLLIGLASPRIRYVRLYGPSLKRGSSLIQSIGFERDLDLEDR